MISLAFHWALNWLIGWGGVSLLVALCAGAVWWFIPAVFIKLRALAFNVAIGALAFNFVYTMGYQHGSDGMRSQWLAAEQRTIEHAADVRRSAEQEIEPVVETQPEACPEPPPVPGTVTPLRAPVAVPRWMRDDKRNRDNRAR